MFRALRNLTDRTFIDLYQDYHEYHANVETNRRIRAEVISNWIDSNSSVLDAGCGDGYNAKIIAEKTSSDVVGCDIVDGTKGRLRVKIIDFNKGFALTEKFDYIVFCEVIEHLIRPHLVLSEAVKYARKGVIVSIPNTGYIWFRLQLLIGVFPRQSFTHLHYWTYKDFLFFAQQLNLEVVKTEFNPTSKLKGFLKKLAPNLFAYQLYYFLAPLAGPNSDD